MGIRCAEDKNLLSLCKRPTLQDTFEIIESTCDFQFKWLSMLIFNLTLPGDAESYT